MNEQNKMIEGGTRSCASEELKKKGAKLKASNDRCYARMAEINRIATKTLVDTTHAEYKQGQYGSDYQAFGEAMCEIRKLVKDSVFDVAPDYEMLARQFMRPMFDADKLAKAIEALATEQPIDYPTFYTPGWLIDLAKKLDARSPNHPIAQSPNPPIIPGCPSLGPKVFPSGADGTEPAEDDDKKARTADYLRKHFSFCDGLFPIRYANTEDGVMASCWISGRRFTMDLDNNERDDGGHDCAAVIKDNGKVVATIETQRGKSISAKVAFAAFKAYVMNLSGSGKFSSRGGYLKQAFKREAQALIDKELA